jgi:hypothetical protein
MPPFSVLQRGFMRSFFNMQLHHLLGTAFVSILGAILSFMPGETKDLPNRPLAPTPTTAAIATVPVVADATSTPQSITASTTDRGSLIVLETSSSDEDDWVTMEWLAGDGSWYEVDGWRGNIHNGQVIWWVAPENLGDGMFKWMVYSDDTKTTHLKSSDPFYLPEQEKITRIFPLDW